MTRPDTDTDTDNHTHSDSDSDGGAPASRPRRSLTEVLSTDELSLIVEPRRDAHGDVARVAADAQDAGASALILSVDAGFASADLSAAQAACSLPILARGDVADPGRVADLHGWGADVVIVAVDRCIQDEHEASIEALCAIVDAAHARGMEVVLTVRDERQLAVAIETDADALNIDNRDDDGSVDVERTFDLLAQVPVGWPVISESIASLEQVPRLHRAGVDALLLDEGHLDTGLAPALAAYLSVAVEPR